MPPVNTLRIAFQMRGSTPLGHALRRHDVRRAAVAQAGQRRKIEQVFAAVAGPVETLERRRARREAAPGLGALCDEQSVDATLVGRDQDVAQVGERIRELASVRGPGFRDRRKLGLRRDQGWGGWTRPRSP